MSPPGGSLEISLHGEAAGLLHGLGQLLHHPLPAGVGRQVQPGGLRLSLVEPSLSVILEVGVTC